MEYFFLSSQPSFKYLKLTHKITTVLTCAGHLQVKYILKYRKVVHVIMNFVNCRFGYFLLTMMQVTLPFLEFLLDSMESRLFYYSFSGDACSDTTGCFLYTVLLLFLLLLLLLLLSSLLLC